MADTGHSAKPVYQFGHFEAVQETGELYRRGQLVKIQELPFRVLVTLLEQQGKIVSRNQLAKQLWPDKTFVEFDQGVSTAVTKLRQAIGDVAENPRFIETVPRRGYRFIAPVTLKNEVPEASAPAVPSVAPISSLNSEPERPAAPVSRSPRRWMWAAGAAVLLLAGLCAFLFRAPFRSKAVFHENDRVILADFDNATGDELYDYTLNSALRVKLDESPYFSLVSANTVQTAMEQLGRTNGRASVKDAQLICQTVHAQAIAHGALSLAQAGAVQLRLEVDACGTGAKLAEEDVLSPSKDFLLTSLGESADRLRRKLGEPESSLQRFSTPLIQATTASFSALNAFASGEQKRARGLDHETLADYKLATDLDPEFALAYARLGTIYMNESEPELSRAAYQKAFDLRAHTTERERLYLTAHYSTSGSGDLERGVEVYRLWRQLYPQDLVAPNNLADIYETLGQPEQARLMAQAALRINPDNAFPYACLLQADQRLGRYDEAREVWREATDRKLNNSVISRMAMFRVGVAQGDDALVRQQLEWAAGNPREGEFLSLVGWMKAASGHLREAQTYFHRAQSVALNNGLKTFAAETGEDLAQFEADFGDTAEARAEVQRSLKLDPSEPNVSAFGAMILANTGDSKQAEGQGRSSRDRGSAGYPSDQIGSADGEGAREPAKLPPG